MKILAQRPTHISAVATVLLITKTFTQREWETERDREKLIDWLTELYFSMVKILAQRLTHISAVATVLLITTTFIETERCYFTSTAHKHGYWHFHCGETWQWQISRWIFNVACVRDEMQSAQHWGRVRWFLDFNVLSTTQVSFRMNCERERERDRERERHAERQRERHRDREWERECGRERERKENRGEQVWVRERETVGQ